MEIKGTKGLVNVNIRVKFFRFVPSCHNGAVSFMSVIMMTDLRN